MREPHACSSPCCETLTRNAKYCSRSCAAKVNNSLTPKRVQGPLPQCKLCDKLVARMGSKYCSAECQRQGISGLKLEAWLRDELVLTKLTLWSRKYLLRRAGGSCEECGWDTPHPILGRPWLTIDHIDGDPDNNTAKNLRVLCLRCHGQTITFGSLNSRSSRKKNGLPDLGRHSARPAELARRLGKPV